MSAPRTFVGFGFGAIQTGLFLYEAFRSGNFARLVVAEVMPETVAAVRAAGGHYSVNIAHRDRVETVRVGPVEIYNPQVPEDRRKLVEAIASAEEIGTAVPSVKFYESPGAGSLHAVLADGLAAKAARGGPQAVIYTAENHNHAAEILERLVSNALPETVRADALGRVRFLNTVIGKMSGLVDGSSACLAPVTPGASRAFLVEAFNRILITRIDFGRPFARGIAVFEEKPDLLPFEEAKLFGHNATHALAAYLCPLVGAAKVAELRAVPGAMEFLRAAFLEESGAALARKNSSVDALFTPAGYRAYADDLLERMTNPFLADTAERVGRDVERKLGWGDRLVGTMRVAMAQGVSPRRYAIGAAAALAVLDRGLLASNRPVGNVTAGLWAESKPDPAESAAVLGLIEDGRAFLRAWQAAGRPPLEPFLAARS